MDNMEYRMQKMDAIMFVERWRLSGYGEYMFVNMWNKADDFYKALVIRQMDMDEFHIILNYPIWK